MATINFRQCTKLSYPWGTTLHILYFTTVQENTPFFGQGRSWHLTNLLYHVLRVSCYSCLAKKSHFIAAKNTHISNILYNLHGFPVDSPMCWCHSLIWTYASGDSRHPHMIYYPQYCCFHPIKVSLYTYSFILMHDRTPRILLLSLTCLNMPADKTITQTIFTVQFTFGSFPHLGEAPGCLIWHLPQVFICH